MSRVNAEETFKFLREVKLEEVLTRPNSDPEYSPEPWFINNILDYFKRVINPHFDSSLICHSKLSPLSHWTGLFQAYYNFTHLNHVAALALNPYMGATSISDAFIVGWAV